MFVDLILAELLGLPPNALDGALAPGCANSCLKQLATWRSRVAN